MVLFVFYCTLYDDIWYGVRATVINSEVSLISAGFLVYGCQKNTLRILSVEGRREKVLCELFMKKSLL